MSPSPLAYTISAICRTGAQKDTRVAASSAMCLADDWAEAGCTDILVTDAFGTAFSRKAFRATLPIVRRMAERRK